MNTEEIAERLWAEGTDHGWWQSAYATLSDCKHNDPIGHSEFMALVERITAAQASAAEPVKNDGLLKDDNPMKLELNEIITRQMLAVKNCSDDELRRMFHALLLLLQVNGTFPPEVINTLIDPRKELKP